LTREPVIKLEGVVNSYRTGDAEARASAGAAHAGAPTSRPGTSTRRPSREIAEMLAELNEGGRTVRLLVMHEEEVAE